MKNCIIKFNIIFVLALLFTSMLNANDKILLYSNLDKSNTAMKIGDKNIVWKQLSNYKDTVKVLEPEKNSYYDTYITHSKIEIARTLNGKQCNLLLNSYVHLNQKFNENLAAFIKSKFNDEINSFSAFNLNNVIIDENGYIVYYDFTTTLGPLDIVPEDDVFSPKSIWPDQEKLELAVKEFVLKNRKVNVPKAYLGKPLFILSFACAQK